MRVRRSIPAPVVLVVVLVLMAGAACSLSSGGDKKGSDSQPTVPASITPPATRTAIPTFTPFPTLTPGGGIIAQVPTATRIVLAPTWTPYPVWTIPATTYPYDVNISYPVDGSTVAGYITVVGSASHPRFLQYALEWGPDPNPGKLWYPVTAPRNQIVIGGGLGAWDTRSRTDGAYQLRLHVWLNDGTDVEDVVRVRISNQQPTAVPTLTPTPKPNHPPVVNPIASQQLQSSASLPISVTSSDPDGDTVNLFVASSNTSIANAQVTGVSQITLTGVTAGAATITVTANDNHGGLSSTAFIVTVQGQNQAPAISPILSQTAEVGQITDVTVSASDPDGDPLTLDAQSDNTGIVTATALGTNVVRLTGVAVGSANVTVTVSDSKGGIIKTTFQVAVGKPNVQPSVQTIPAQVLSVGDTLDVSYVASDPDGDALSQTVSSDTPGVVTAAIVSPGTIRLSAVSAGPATVTLQVEDGVNPATIATFPVTVVAGNVAPALGGVLPQTMSVGEARDVAYAVVDPEGDPLTQNVSSDNTGVVQAAVNTPGFVTLNAMGAGTATVTLSVSDPTHPPVTTSFTVSVAAVNLPPAIETIFPQVLGTGDVLNVPYTVTDPDGDPLTPTASSDNSGVVTAAVNTPGTVTLTAAGPGSATVTLSVNDGHNPAVTMPFSVTVTANTPPSVSAIGPQTLMIGQMLDVAYSASDPEGDALTETASSDNGAVVTAVVSTPGTITLTAVGPGVANVTLSVSDGKNAPVSTVFAVTVSSPNGAPSIVPIGPQALTVGTAIDVAYTATDPEGDPLTQSASSDNTGVVTASVNVPGTITLTAVGAGSANVTLTVNDLTNPAVSTVFGVTVNAANGAPSIAPIGPQMLTVGTAIDVAYTATDPEGDPLTQSASSDNTGVVTASVNVPGTITLTAMGAGSANVTLTVNDPTNPAVSTVFGVTVNAPNGAPSIVPIGPQTLMVGTAIDVAYTATDPEGDPLTQSASSDNPGVVTASVNVPGTITLNAVGAGSANVTLTVNDMSNPAVSTVFTVTVNAPNGAPSIAPIGPQILTAGTAIDVAYTATDPEGDPLTQSASSDNPGVVTASVNVPGTITLNAVGAGSANVTLTVNDMSNPAVSTVFAVTVNAANANPIIQPIGDQTVSVGSPLVLPVTVSDPDGDPVTITAVSDTPSVATANTSGPAEITVGGVAPGTARVYVDGDDGKGGQVEISFQVTVTGANQPPVIQPIGDQTLTVGENVSIAISYSDPDGDPLVITALSQNGGVAYAEAVMATSSINLSAVGEGVTQVQVIADDAKGGVTTISFNVTVSSPQQPSFDLMAYPVVPDISPAMGATLAQLYQSGVLNFGNQGGAFSKIGDDATDSPSFLAPFATPGAYNLGNFGPLQATIDFYSTTSVRATNGPVINSLNVDSVAAGPGYGIDGLASGASGPPCDAIGGGTLLSCELALTKPAVALISFGAPNVTYMPPEQFRAELQSLVSDLLSNHGVIPVLATIPAGNGVTSEQLLPYNQAIVEIATQSGVGGVPLWNLWRAMSERGISDPNSVAPDGAGSFADASLSYGANIRNLTALQTLEAVRQGAGIN